MSPHLGAPLLALGLATSLLWSLYLLLTRHVVSGARLDAWAYTLVQLLAAGLVLLWVGRRAAGSWSELLAPWTVGYAFLRVGINGATAASVVWLAVTQSTLLATMSVLIGALSGWFLTRQAPARRDWWGLVLLAAGIAGFALALSGEAWRGLAWLVLSESMAVAGSWLIAYHPRNRAAGTAARSRFTGEILVAASLALAPEAWRGLLWLAVSETMAVAGSWLIAYHPRNRAAETAARSRFTGEILVAASLALIIVWSLLGASGAIVSPWAGAGDAFGRIELWIYATLAGLLFRAPGTWLGFWTINKTGVQTYLIALTAMPFMAIALEALAAQLGWLAPPRLSTAEWLAAAVILAASVWLIVLRMTGPTAAGP